MWKRIKNNYKIILFTIGLFLIGSIIAFVCENYYRQFVRFVFKVFYDNKIEFTGKNFHLFASIKFVIAFGSFVTLTFSFFLKHKLNTQLKAIFYLSSIFLISSIVFIVLDVERLIIECTACSDGIRHIGYNEITYDLYFISSLIVSLFYTKWLIHKHNKNHDDLIGLWTKEDDGSGLLEIFGWSIQFNSNKTGECKFWETSSIESLDFEFQWERLNNDEIRIRGANDKEWTTFNYEIIEVMGAYNSKQYKLMEKNKNTFWNSPEPLYKRKQNR